MTTGGQREKAVPGARAGRSRKAQSAAPSRWHIPDRSVADHTATAHALGERIKELNCLYGIAMLAERQPSSVGELLAGVAGILPRAWQYPEVTVARVTLEGRAYDSPGFALSAWGQAAPIIIGGYPAGEVLVCYTEERPASQEGPFLREERTLIDAVAEYVGTIVRRIRAEQDVQEANRLLTVEREALRESNAALRAVLARIGEEKQDMRRDIRENVEKVLFPILDAVEVELPANKRAYVGLLRRNLRDIAEPFTRHLAPAEDRLTPAEVAVCSMIRNGLRTKEIARLRGISAATVCRHREHIRRKLGLSNRAMNLTTYLQGRGIGAGTAPGA